MKLEDYLKANKNTKGDFLLGTENGSGWIFIGTAEELLEKLDSIDTYFVTTAISRTVSNEKEAREALKRDFGKIEALEDLYTAIDGIRNKIRTAVRLRKYAAVYQKLGSRSVVSHGFNEDQNGTLVIISGKEMGDLWWKGKKKLPF